MSYLAFQGYSSPLMPLADACRQALSSDWTAGQHAETLRNLLTGMRLENIPCLDSFVTPAQRDDLNRVLMGHEFTSASDQDRLRGTLTRIAFVHDSLLYHQAGPGKTTNRPIVPLATQRDLSVAYSPGVAFPCFEIERDPKLAAIYTNRQNTVFVISNGGAILGIGNRGALASKPVMEGKAVLFHQFAGINAIDLEVAAQDPKTFVEAVRYLWPTMAGINLEDISAPSCFEIEGDLIGHMEGNPLPTAVMHDDQHGTAVITAAALENALRVQGKIHESARNQLRIVMAGAGASGIACAKMIITALRIRKEQILMVDTKGVIRTGRGDFAEMPEYKRFFAQDTDIKTLAEALKGADVFIGLSGANTVDQAMVASMADKPIIFAMANPDPEILPNLAHEARGSRKDLIIGTGRSDFPNQINNVLGFPFLFRGAIDVGAKRISKTMKVKAANALAELARQPVPAEVSSLYGADLVFGPDYVVPKPFDPRVIDWVAPAVAEAAVLDSITTFPFDERQYRRFLRRIRGKAEDQAP